MASSSEHDHRFRDHRHQGGAQPFVNQRMLDEAVLPLPPLAEQHEIVAEVERRMSVVNAIETEVEHGLKRAARLRQAILKRGFEGKLVLQNLNEESASALCSEREASLDVRAKAT